MLRTIDWVDGSIELIDQTLLPNEVKVLRVSDLDTLIECVQRLAVRGAPALGVAGAMGVALIAQTESDPGSISSLAQTLADARPTAVNLSWGVKRALTRLDEGPDAILEEALRIRDEDIAACTSMGLKGAELIRGLVENEPARIMTVCNTGALAAVERGTALGVAQTILEQGWLEEVFPMETRPLLQGARLTAWELTQMGAPFRLIIDSAAPFLMSRGIANVAIAGADRIAANGDTANKVGTYSLALASRAAGVPFIIVAPESTIDVSTETGNDIPIEDRGSSEVVTFAGRQTAPVGTSAVNPAFDVTPHELITAIVTEKRVIRCDKGQTPSNTRIPA